MENANICNKNVCTKRSNVCVCVCVRAQLCLTLCDPMICSPPGLYLCFRQEYWSGLPCPSPGDLPNPGIESASLTSPALAGGFFTTSAIWETLHSCISSLPTCAHAQYTDRCMGLSADGFQALGWLFLCAQGRDTSPSLHCHLGMVSTTFLSSTNWAGPHNCIWFCLH